MNEDELIRKIMKENPSFYDMLGEPPLIIDSKSHILTKDEINEMIFKELE